MSITTEELKEILKTAVEISKDSTICLRKASDTAELMFNPAEFVIDIVNAVVDVRKEQAIAKACSVARDILDKNLRGAAK